MRNLQTSLAGNDESSKTTTFADTMRDDSRSGTRPPPQKHWAKRYRTELAASSSTIISTFLAFPLESIKTRIQGDSPNFRSCVREVWGTEGFRGFWRGVAAPMASVTAVRTLSFSVYQKAKYSASEAIGRLAGTEEPLATVNKTGSKPDVYTLTCFGLAGAAAGASSTFIACPFELIKNAMVLARQIAKSSGKDQDPIKKSYVGKNTFATAKQITANCGPMGLYTGFNLQLTRETIGTAVYFMAYESGKQLLVSYQHANNPTSPLAVALAGGFCGVVSLAITYPLDRAKTAYQKERLELGRRPMLRKHTIQYFKRASYQGLTVAATRSACTNAILFSSFEYMKKQINRIDETEN